MAHELPALPYAFNALEPYIDGRTMQIHHDLHHAGYVNKLNAALADHPELQNRTIEDLVKSIKTLPDSVRSAVQNNGGGHYNHTIFWTLMGPNCGGEPNGDLAGAINDTWGTLGKFKEEFNSAAVTRFGSGWAWLVKNNDGSLAVTSTANQDNPISNGQYPIIGLDVWEHAYYLKYQNRRPEYIDNWWHVVNWDEAAKRYVG